MNRPFNLVKVFSITSCFVVILFMIGLSWILGQIMENQLLERDRFITATTIQLAALDYLGESPFDNFYHNTRINKKILDVVMRIPGTLRFEIIDPFGTVLWSSDLSDVGKKEINRDFNKALKGKSVISSSSSTLSLFYSNIAKKNISSLYIPIVRNQKVIGVFELYRTIHELHKQVQELKYKIYLYCILFGGLLYLAMMFIIVPTARVLKHQNQQLIVDADSLEQVNTALKKTQDQLVQKERLSAIGEVCGSVAHGLKNPIASVRSAVQLLTVSSLSRDEQLDIITDVLNEVDRLTRRLNDLLNFIRPFDPDLQYVQLKEVLKNSARGLHWKALDEKIEIKLIEPEEMESIQIDSALIEEAILIVLSNAMDAISQKGQIFCRVEVEHDWQIIIIQDHGEGIAKEILPKIFEQFFTTHSRGIGLGLAICKKIMELHQGRVVIESEAGKGTTAKLFLPITRSI